MMIVDSVDDAHSRVLEAKGHAIQSAQVEVNECDEREKSHQEALLSVQAQIGEEVCRTEEAYQTRKELGETPASHPAPIDLRAEAVVPRIPSTTTKELQGLGCRVRPYSRRLLMMLMIR